MTLPHDIPDAATLLDLDAPELALLAALDRMLRATRAAIQAANPELLPRFADDPVPHESFHRYWAAHDIRALARLLRDAIGRYRHAVTAPVHSLPGADPLFPF